jgi:pimeloyl-ACP methyl ester carboxylesterase
VPGAGPIRAGGAGAAGHAVYLPLLEMVSVPMQRAPTRLLIGGTTWIMAEVTVQHSCAVAAALGDGRLSILPGSHALPLELPEVVNALLVTFLRKGAPSRLLP